MNRLSRKATSVQDISDNNRNVQNMFANLFNNLIFVCGICNESFIDPYDHLNRFSNYNHLVQMASILRKNSNYCPLCGGEIAKRGDESHYEVQCTRCEYLFDED